MPFTQANGISTYFQISGEGPPLFLLCGFGQNYLSWEGIMPFLTPHFQVIQFDLRGAGQTEAPNESYSIEMMAQDVVGLMEALGIEHAHFMGESMGAAILLQLCIDHPHRVNKSVLCAPFAHFPPTSQHTLRTQLDLFAAGVPFLKLLELNLSWLFSDWFLSDPRQVARYLKQVASNPYPQTQEGRLGQADALLSFDVRPHLETIPHPLLLLIGEHDLAIPPYISHVVAKHTRNNAVHVLKEGGHLFPYESPEQTAKHAVAFLKAEN